MITTNDANVRYGYSVYSGSLTFYCKFWAFPEASNSAVTALRTLKRGNRSGSSGKSGRGGDSGPYDVGYRLAYQLWQDGYECTRDEINNIFEPDVEDEVYEECEETYQYWPDRERDCKRGADDFVRYKRSDCLTGTECKDDFGNVAAREIAASLCPVGLDSEGSDDKSRFNPECEEQAKIRCYDRVVTLVEDWCDSPDFTLRYLKRQCDEKIEDLID